MNTILSALRDVLGTANFWKQLPNNSGGLSNYQWDYGAMIEYMLAGMILLVVISSVFKFLITLVKR